MSARVSQSPTQEEIRTWLVEQGWSAEGLAELPGDVSLRRYLRLTTSAGPAIVAAYPAAIRDSCHRFVETTRLLSQAGVRVPEILASDCENGFTLLEDVGKQTLYDRRGAGTTTLAEHFWQATTQIVRIQSLPIDVVAPLNPSLSAELLWRELRQTWSSLLEPRGVVKDPVFARALEQTLQEICRLLDAETFVPCHRDFMSRNLVPVDPYPDLAVLDHQDLRLGPQAYDLASLLNDSLFPSEELEEEILQHFFGGETAERLHYHRAAAQRTLKATGTYETFAQRGFTRHRPLIPETLARALGHLGQLPEAAAIRSELAARLAPLIIC